MAVMKEFILLGLSENQGVQKMYFVMFLLFYTLTVTGNLTVLTVMSSRPLNSPMYFFLCHLSFVDVCYSSVTAPQLISGFLVENNTISFAGCIGQLFGLHGFGCTEVFILTAVAYDHCVAVCRPLHYPALTPQRLCGRMVGVSWTGGFLHSTLQTFPTLPCSLYTAPIKSLTTSVMSTPCSPWPVQTRVPCPLSCFLILVTSYMGILASLRGQRLARWHKALSTRGSHITVVILCLGHSTVDTGTAMFYVLITPMLKPLIYTLWNGEVKGAMRKQCRRKVGSRNRKGKSCGHVLKGSEKIKHILL
uniref:G-protein coupled receptors family 1 profile domain-containing protein n=1 Tax=Serinus canaria TaxID=9135 RepID=A0A8C9N1V5_SERCA